MFAGYLGFASLQLGHDKLIHFITFFVLTAEFYHMWQMHRPWKLTFVCMTLGASVALEFVQNLVNPERVFDWIDIVYNVHGSGLALALCVVASLWARGAAYRRPLDCVEPDYVNISMADVGR